MAIHAGRHPFGTDRGRSLLRTLRDGLAAQAGHDLTMEATRWSGELTADDTGSVTGLDVRIDMGSLVVLEGSGGIKPLTDRDQREIALPGVPRLAEGPRRRERRGPPGPVGSSGGPR